MNQAQLKVGAIVQNKVDKDNYRKITGIRYGVVYYMYNLNGSFSFDATRNNSERIQNFLSDNIFIRNENDFYADQKESVEVPKSTRSKYNRDLIALGGEKVEVDVYRVLAAFNVTDPALQHAAKKILCAGLRGHKDRVTDLEDIIDSVQKALVMENQQ